MTVAKVEVELFFPLSRAVQPKTTGRIKLAEEIAFHEPLGSLLTRLAKRYPGLQEIFEVEKQELHLFVTVVINDSVIIFPDGLTTSLNDGDEVSLLPQHVGG